MSILLRCASLLLHNEPLKALGHGFDGFLGVFQRLALVQRIQRAEEP